MRRIIKNIPLALLSLLLVFISLPIASLAAPSDDMNVIYAKVPADWANPAVWAFDSDGNNAFDAWPGEVMDKDSANEGWYYIYIPKSTDHVIINANNGDVQTAEQVVTGNSWITVASADDVTVSTDQQTQGDIPEYVEKFKVHAIVDSSWQNPCMWAWNTDGTNAYSEWPGEPMIAGDDGTYTISVPKFCDHIIVNANEGSVQTEDIEIDPAEVWVTVDADGKNEISYVDPAKASAPNIHVYVKAPSDWENPNLWAWSAPDGTNAFSAWPGEALEEGDNGWLTKEVPGWINSLIVNGNDGSIQTSDISVDAGKDVWIVVSGADDAYEVSYEEPAATDDAASADMETASEEKTESKTNPAIPIAIVVVCAAAAAIIGGTVYQKKKKNNK